MQITTATRTVEIYANNTEYVTYRNVKDGVAYGPVRTAMNTAKAGSVGREVFDAAQVPAQVPAQDEVTEGTEVKGAGRQGRITHIVPAAESRNGRAWAGVLWDTTTSGVQRPSYGMAYLTEVTLV